MKYITSLTHRYISVRTTPSDYMLKKFHKHEIKAVRHFHSYYAVYLEFYKNLVEFITGNSYDDHYTKEYMMGTMDATKEEIHELTGIKIACSGNDTIFCIPRKPENDRIYMYIIDRVPHKYKVLKKTRGTYMDHGVQTFQRDMNRTPNELKELQDKI